MTIGELKKLISTMPDDTLVVTREGDDYVRANAIKTTAMMWTDDGVIDEDFGNGISIDGISIEEEDRIRIRVLLIEAEEG